jgi:glycosyltransferase involved in cell wall biosynthesis
LQRTLTSIIAQNVFVQTEKIEIVVSDNGSNDGTREYLNELILLYPNKIRIFLSEVNRGANANFLKVLDGGTGKYLKLNNDTQMHMNGSLDFMLGEIEQYGWKENILFFSHLNEHSRLVEIYKDLNLFIKDYSYWTTWTALFCISRDQFNKVKHFFESSKCYFPHVAAIYNLIIEHEYSVKIITKEGVFVPIEPKGKGGYDLVEAFVDEYFFMLKGLYEKKFITYFTLINERRKIIFNHTYPYIWACIRNPEHYNFKYRKYLKRLLMALLPDFLSMFKLICLELNNQIVLRIVAPGRKFYVSHLKPIIKRNK